LLQQLLGPQNCMYLARILALTLAIPVHETAHAFVSDRLGDHTARSLGRLTLNPLKHFDLLGLLSMLIIGVGWAKPVPVDARYYKNRKTGMAATALAGPLSNLLLALLSAIALKTVYYLAFLSAATDRIAAWPLGFSAAYYVLYFFTLINVSLALFNLLPVPPLDGSRIFGLILPEKLYFGIMRYERYIMYGLLALIVILPLAAGFSPIGWLLGPLSERVMDGIFRLTGFIDLFFARILNG
jgi:Zn-dependent protease